MSGCRHSSPSGELPFLVLPSPKSEIVPLYKLHQFIVEKNRIPSNERVTVYLNLIDTKIHLAWVYLLLVHDIDGRCMHII
jgi:hypothetical protein